MNRKQKKAYGKFREEDAFSDVRGQLEKLKERCTVHYVDADRITSPGGIDENPPQSIDALCVSIMKYGLIEPLIVRRMSEDDSSLGAVFLLISGRRRLAALKKLGFRTVPCLIADVRAENAFETILSRKLASSDNDMFAAADALKRLYEEKYGNLHDYARALGTDENTLGKYIAAAGLTNAERSICRKYAFPKELIFSIAVLRSKSERRKAVAECGACLQHLTQTYTQPLTLHQQRSGMFLSLLPVYNSLDRIAAQLRTSGIPAYTVKSETTREFTVTFHIPKETARILTAPDPPSSSTDKIV